MTIKDILCILAITASAMCVLLMIINNRGYDRLLDIVSGMLKNLGKVAEDVVQMQADIANLYDLRKENLEKAEESVKGLARRFEDINDRVKALEKANDLLAFAFAEEWSISFRYTSEVKSSTFGAAILISLIFTGLMSAVPLCFTT